MRTPFKKILQILDGTPATSSKTRQRGQSFVELAFITPILLIMVAGIIEIGWYANNYINLLEAAKVGARRGPFLYGENAPQAFEEKFRADNDGDGNAESTSIIHPFINYGSVPLLLQPADEDDPVLTNTRYSTRGYTFPLGDTSCNFIPEAQYGFYNLIACTVLDSLDPLEMRIAEVDLKEEPVGEWYQDDIVISVFSMQKINNGPIGTNNLDGFDGDEDGNGTPHDFDISEWGYPPGHQVVAVGRWPSEANECFDGTNNLDERDPFNYIEPDIDNVDTIIVTTGGEDVLLPLELSKPVYDEFGEVVDYEGYHDTNPERQRGWVYTGQRRVDIPDGTAFVDNCWGSEFTLQEVQELMNLPRFVLAGEDNYQNRRRYLPSQGIVLVEIFWEHDLLMGDSFPLFYSSYNLLTSIGGAGEPYNNDVNVIHVWAAFPSPAAEPNIAYTLD